MRFFSLLGLLFFFQLQTSTESFAYYYPSNNEKVLNRIAFGSCSIQRLNQSYWDKIGDLEPDLWIWLGDMIYADVLPIPLREHEYNVLRSNKYYQKFRLHTPIIGTWDDHDFGWNNVGTSFISKFETERLFFDFLDEPAASPRRQQEGVYTTFRYGPPGKQVRIISLDLRYFRDEPGPNATILGETQWNWLEKEMLAPEGDEVPEITFVLCSSQFLPMDHTQEKWADYPKDRARMLNLLDKSPGRFVMLSGDRHFTEVSKMTLPSGKPLYDLTSSGLTHVRSNHEDNNRYRVGNFWNEKNFGILDLDWTQTPVKVTFQMWKTSGQMLDLFLLEN